MGEVIIDRVKVKPPTRKDHLLKVPRQVLFMSQDDVWRKARDNNELIEHHLHRSADLERGLVLEHSGIVCDSCGEPIPQPYVWCLIIGGHCWGTLCQSCVDRYHSGKPRYVLAPP